MKKLAIENNAQVKVQGTKAQTKALVLSGLLIGIGFVLHAVTPPLFFGIKPDFLLACMFIAVIANCDLKNTLVTGIVAGIVAALTTSFPGGQIPSVIDKVASALFVLALYQGLPKMNGMTADTVRFGLISCIGTILSGVVFLGSALAIAGLPAPFMVLVTGIVLPTAAANTVLGVMMYQLYKRFA